MKKLILILLLLILSYSQLHAQLNTFSDGDIVSAEKMNENFEYLEQQFRGARSTDVKCGEGEKVGDAISNGYTNITISGTCAENLRYSVWVGDSSADDPSSNKLAPRFLKIVGTNPSTDKIVDASANEESTISVTSGATLLLENLTVSGGRYGVNAQHNSNLYLSGVTIDSFTQRGVRIADSSWLSINEGGATIKGPGSGTGVYFTTASSGWISSVTISGVARGIDAIFGSTVATGPIPYDKEVQVYEINASDYGVRLNNSRFLHYGGLGSIMSTSITAAWVYQGIFDVWNPAKLEIKDSIGGQGFFFGQSKGTLNNLTMIDFNNVGSGWNPVIQISKGSSVDLNSAEISGATDGTMITIEKGSTVDIENLILSDSTGASLVDVGGGSHLQLNSSMVLGEIRDVLISINEGSSGEIRNSTLKTTNGEQGLAVTGNSRLGLRNSTLDGNAYDRLVEIWESSSMDIQDSTLKITSGGAGLTVTASSWLNFRNSSISGMLSEELVGIERSIANIHDSTISLDGGSRGLNITGSHISIRNSSISGKGNEDLVRVSDLSSVSIGYGSSFDQTNDSSPEILVSSLSHLNVWDSESSINRIDCYNRGYVSVNEGVVVDLDPSCTE